MLRDSLGISLFTTSLSVFSLPSGSGARGFLDLASRADRAGAQWLCSGAACSAAHRYLVFLGSAFAAAAAFFLAALG